MVFSYYKLRVKLIGRALKETGISPLFALVIATLLFWFFLKNPLIDFKYVNYIYLLVPLFLVSKNAYYTEKNKFLRKICSTKEYQFIHLSENILISLPFIVFLIYKGKLYMAAGSALVLILISFLKIHFKTRFVLPTPFGKHPFEFTMGFRKNILFFLFSFMLAILAVYFDNQNLGLFSLLLTFFVASFFYLNPENPFFLWQSNSTGKAFLHEKIKIASYYGVLLSSPIFIILSLFFFDELFKIILIEVVGIGIVNVGLLSKYMVYPQKINLTEALNIALSIIFPPIILFFLPFLYYEAKKNLNTLIDD